MCCTRCSPGGRAPTLRGMQTRCGTTSTWACGWRRWLQGGQPPTSASAMCSPTSQARLKGRGVDRLTSGSAACTMHLKRKPQHSCSSMLRLSKCSRQRMGIGFPQLLSGQRMGCACAAGARVLRQDPLECAFEFICSSNNHISRIHGMVETLCRAYGTCLHATHPAAGSSAACYHSPHSRCRAFGLGGVCSAACLEPALHTKCHSDGYSATCTVVYNPAYLVL